MWSVLLSLSLGHAVEVELTVMTPGARSPLHLVLADVVPGERRDVDLASVAGARFPVLSVQVDEAGSGEWQATFTVAETSRRDRRRGVAPVVLTRPTLRTRTGEVAEFFAGHEVPVADGQVRREGYSITCVVSTSEPDAGR